MSVSQDGSESVDQFLARIASVREGRDQATEERSRRMEEDFLKNRKERQARRLERARSLSPSKTGPLASTAFPSPAATRDVALNPPVDFSPRASTLSRSNAVNARTSPRLQSKRSEPDLSTSPTNLPSPATNNAGLSRTGTLSWQQRPARDGGLGRARPLSTIGTIRAIPKSEPHDEQKPSGPSRQEIAASLATRDASWFRQTQDRGVGSAAFRKNQVEDPMTVQHKMSSQGLPGMSREGPRSITHTPIRENVRAPPSPAMQSPPLSVNLIRDVSPTPQTNSLSPKLSPSPQQASHREIQLEPASSDLSRTASILARRSPSPTKGLGGFVESAMMKRSDSVNKRWSVQANAGLKRGDSVGGARPLSGIRSMHAATLSRTANRDASSSPVPTSRYEPREELKAVETVESPSHAHNNSAAPYAEPKDLQKPREESMAPNEVSADSQLPISPSKTLDTRRWSPTKSSWLESALLSKPETPKPLSIRDDVPAWKASLQRNKASRDISADTTKPSGATADTATPGNIKRPGESPVVAKKPESISREPTISAKQSIFNTRPSPAEDLVPTKQSLEQNTKSEIELQSVEVSMASDGPNRSIETKSPARTPSTPVESKAERKIPPALRPKPQTPPQTDFRATLRSRAAPSSEGTKTEPEFRSMFGKLKPTQTQNYVAPDTLKTNILTGKAALSVTSGPQKTQHVDEFKESILHKKEAMKTSATQKELSEVMQPMKPMKPEPVIPEALARRKTLHKTTPSITKLQNSVAITAASSTSPQEQPKPAISPKPKAFDVPGITKSSNNTKTLVSSQAIGQKQIISSSVSSIKASATSRDEIGAEPVARSTTTQPQSKLHTDPVVAAVSEKAELRPGSKLASRLNPSLATLLTRGISPHSNASKSSTADDSRDSVVEAGRTDIASPEPAASGELKHMTKGRARGPKRRAPKAQQEQTNTPPQSNQTLQFKRQAPKPQTQQAIPSQQSNSTSQIELPESPKKEHSPTRSVQMLRQTFVTSPVPPMLAEPLPKPVAVPKPADNKSSGSEAYPSEVRSKLKPAVVSKSSELRKTSGVLQSQVDGLSNFKLNNQGFKIASDDGHDGDIDDKPVQKISTATSKSPATQPLTPSKSRINTSKPAGQDSSASTTKPQSPKYNMVRDSSSKTAPTKTCSTSSEPRQKPNVPRKPSTNIKIQRQNVASDDLKAVLSAYFPSAPDRQQKAEFDIASLISQTREGSAKTKSVLHNISEITSGGKKISLPSQQEHILYEESMYLLIHKNETAEGGKSAEVFLWRGDDVSEAAAEDAQAFCKKDAREHNARLEVVRQGKEPARFFQALGGIIITRRSKTDSLYMLRGRRHLGHIAFDEVDYNASNLCSGFPYIISARFGKLYLWKGKGSGADEIGCARLIGMDVGLTGEIEEIVEGEEPVSFWDSFPEPREKPQWSHEWQRRAEHDCFPTTLYRIDLDRPKSSAGFWGMRAASPSKSTNKAAVDAISPFCSYDVEPSNVYILDAFRSIYVLLNQQANTKSTEIVTALHLAQELAFLSPSIQGRSLMPSSYVIFGDPPPDVTICFRKWPSTATKSDQVSTCVELERVMEALKL